MFKFKYETETGTEEVVSKRYEALAEYRSNKEINLLTVSYTNSNGLTFPLWEKGTGPLYTSIEPMGCTFPGTTCVLAFDDLIFICPECTIPQLTAFAIFGKCRRCAK